MTYSTTPQGGPDLNKIPLKAEQQALSEMHSMLFGTKMLQSNPGVVWALQQQKAHPADSQAIDQFMQALDAEKQVRLAGAGGQKIQLDDNQTGMLDQMGVNYKDVQLTQQDAVTATQNNVTQQTQGTQKAKVNADGSIATDKDGNVVLEPVEASLLPSHSGSLFGHIIHDLNNWVVKDTIGGAYRDVIKPVLSAAGKGFNYITTSISQQSANAGIASQNFGQPAIVGAVSNEGGTERDMQALGYDPNSFWSRQAYQASGKAHTNTQGLEDQWDTANPSGLFGWNGQQAVSNAVRFLNDPAEYQKTIENDPHLTPQQVAAQLKQLNSPQFQTLTRQVVGNSANLGTDIAKNVFRIDPVNHPKVFALSAAAANLASAFLIDPLMLAGAGFNVARFSRVGLDTALDSEQAAAHLDPAAQAVRAETLPATTPAEIATKEHATAVATAQARQGGVLNKAFLSPLQRRYQDFIDTSHEMAAKSAQGDTAGAAALQGKISAQFKELSPLIPDVLGKNQIVGFSERGPILGEGEGIHTLGDMANYIASKGAFVRLVSGRAAVQSRLTPGATSGLGLRWFKGNVSQWMTARSAARQENMYDKVISAAEADPERATPLINAGFFTRVQPEANDAIGLNDEIIATPAQELSTEGDMITQYRPALDYISHDANVTDGGQLALTPAGKGAVAFAQRVGGKPLGDLEVGFSRPAAIAARARLRAQRLSTLLPRNTLLDLNDVGNVSSDKVFNIAMYYMNRGDANALRMAYNLGDGGQRKAVISGLIDQMGHSAGLGKSVTGQHILDTLKTSHEAYNTAGDEILLNGEAVAQHAGQTNDKWLLPGFREIQQVAARITIGEKTFGRAFTSDQADNLMGQWKMGALFKPSTVTRNQLEGWLRTTLEGKLGPSLQAKAFATQTNRELWARGLSLDTKAEYERLLAGGETERAAKLAKGQYLSGQNLGRSTPLQRMTEFAPLALAGRAYRQAVGRTMSDAMVTALGTLPKEDLEQAMRGYSQQMTEDALGYRNAAGWSQKVVADGLSPMLTKYQPATLRGSLHEAKAKGMAVAEKKAKKATVWTQQDADSTIGADRFSNALHSRVDKTPGVAEAAFKILEDPENYSISHLVEAMDDPTIRSKMQLTSWGHVWSPNNDINFVRTEDPAEIAVGKTQFATKVLNDYRHLFTQQDGNLSAKLIKQTRDLGRAPDGDWIAQNLKNAERPHGVLAPEVTATSPDGQDVRSVVGTIQDLEGGAYQWMVERPLQRTTSAPIFMANYAEARVGLNSAVENMVSQGVGREAANELAKETAIKNAWVKTETMIDDPGQKSQFDIVARNFFPFSRATTAMIRRWGGGIYRDPAQARQMMLAYEGAQHAGLVYTNQYGEPTYVYPGSGAMNAMMRGISELPGMGNLAKFPISASMTGGVLMSVPGADNPLRISAGPMIMVPLRELSNLLPGDQKILFNEVDSAINGPIGVGSTGSALLPAMFKKFYTNMNTDERNSAMASSTVGAMANLAAAGMVPPKDADNATLEAWRRNVQAQTRNQLFLRAVFGLFAPAAPSTPSEGTSASGSDYSFQVRGIKQLSEEYKSLLNDVNGNVARASAIWAALHPEKTVYEISGSRSTASKVSLPSTDAALAWMIDNKGFIQHYGNVASYFLPMPKGNEPFSEQAYRAQIELGLREKKTPDDFMQDIYIRDAESTFYPWVAAYNTKIQAAKAAGDTETENAWSDAKSKWEAQFKQQNPLFGNKLDSYGDARALARAQLQNLTAMVAANQVPNGEGKLVDNLIKTYTNYENYIGSIPGQTQDDRDAKTSALQMFNSWAEKNIAGTDLVDLYNGVFRVLNTNIEDLNKLPGGTQ
jgi:hypothetical protein